VTSIVVKMWVFIDRRELAPPSGVGLRKRDRNVSNAEVVRTNFKLCSELTCKYTSNYASREVPLDQCLPNHGTHTACGTRCSFRWYASNLFGLTSLTRNQNNSKWLQI